MSYTRITPCIKYIYNFKKCMLNRVTTQKTLPAILWFWNYLIKCWENPKWSRKSTSYETMPSLCVDYRYGKGQKTWQLLWTILWHNLCNSSEPIHVMNNSNTLKSEAIVTFSVSVFSNSFHYKSLHFIIFFDFPSYLPLLLTVLCYQFILPGTQF